MIVYGDPHYRQKLSASVDQLRVAVEQTDSHSVDELRLLLIRAGQVEQGVADLRCSNESRSALLDRIIRVTDSVADLFYRLWSGAPVLTTADARLRQISGTLQEIPIGNDWPVTIKIPEGFAYYALFPEQHCAAALHWAKQHAGAIGKAVVVVGIRSIGTTLSAVVMATLRANGWQVQRVTARPEGHPFCRDICLALPGKYDQALVVDEGPGLSGSSMAAAARSLMQAGISAVSFLPGHTGEPGAAASDATRKLWAAIPRYFEPLAQLKWSGSSLAESLAQKAAELTGTRFGTVEELGAGGWRPLAFPTENAWPAVVAQFERMKFLCRSTTSRSVLWKFSGLAPAQLSMGSMTETAFATLLARAKEGYAPRPLGAYRGFIAMPWIEGERLTPRDGRDPRFLEHMGRYILKVSSRPLSRSEAGASLARLKEVVQCNVRESLGEDWASRAQLSEPCTTTAKHLPTYGDGRLAPHNWIRTRHGHILKTNSEGHDADHTAVGKQTVLWDVAGALIEWNLSVEDAAPLLSTIRKAVSFEREALDFYQIAYAAFRVGLTSLGLGQTFETAERTRLQKATDFYQARLERLLTQRVPSGK
jgi:hypothetical protein